MEDEITTGDTTTADATDVGDAPAAGGAGAGDVSDAALVAQIEAEAKGGAAATGEQDDAAAAGEADGADGEGGDKPEGGEGKDKPQDGDTEIVKARKIMAAANRRLAKAKALAGKSKTEIAAALKKNPLKTLRELGTSIEEVLAAGEGEDDTAAGDDKPTTTEDRVAALERQRLEDAQRARQANVRELTERAHNHLKEAKATDGKPLYPRINRGNAHELVTDLCVEYFNAHKVALPLAQAAKQVEDYLAGLAGTDAPAPAAGKPRQPSQTLTNTAIRNVAPVVADDLPIDDDDARHAAVMKELGLKTA